MNGDRATTAADCKRIAAITQLHTHATCTVAGHHNRAAIGGQARARDPHTGGGIGGSGGTVQRDIAAVSRDCPIADIQTECGTGAVQANGSRRGGDTCAIGKLNPHALRRIASHRQRASTRRQIHAIGIDTDRTRCAGMTSDTERATTTIDSVAKCSRVQHNTTRRTFTVQHNIATSTADCVVTNTTQHQARGCSA